MNKFRVANNNILTIFYNKYLLLAARLQFWSPVDHLPVSHIFFNILLHHTNTLQILLLLFLLLHFYLHLGILAAPYSTSFLQPIHYPSSAHVQTISASLNHLMTCPSDILVSILCHFLLLSFVSAKPHITASFIPSYKSFLSHLQISFCHSILDTRLHLLPACTVFFVSLSHSPFGLVDPRYLNSSIFSTSTCSFSAPPVSLSFTHTSCLALTDFCSSSLQSIPPSYQTLPPDHYFHCRSKCQLEILQRLLPDLISHPVHHYCTQKLFLVQTVISLLCC